MVRDPQRQAEECGGGGPHHLPPIFAELVDVGTSIIMLALYSHYSAVFGKQEQGGGLLGKNC